MLKRLTYKIVAIILLIPFIAASTGLSIFLHKCSCEGKIIVTLFEEHKCHDTEISSCCESKDNIVYNDFDNDCGCKTEHLTIKVDELFNISDATVLNLNSDLLTIHLFNNNSSLEDLFQDIDDNNTLYLPIKSPPIKPAGRVLINLLHQSKTPDFIS